MSRITELKKEQVIQSAIKIFQEKGLEQATMEAIARDAEVSKRTLYKYFPTKNAVCSI